MRMNAKKISEYGRRFHKYAAPARHATIITIDVVKNIHSERRASKNEAGPIAVTTSQPAHPGTRWRKPMSTGDSDMIAQHSSA